MIELYLISLVMVYLITKYDDKFEITNVDEFIVAALLLPLVAVFMMVIDIIEHGEK